MTRVVIVTGAAGGMGRTCARLLGASARLVLTDAAGSALERFAGELADEGYDVAAVIPGDLADDAVLSKLAGAMTSSQPWTLVHAAGVGGAQGDWWTIVRVNLVATVKLLNALEPVLREGCCAVLIASGAGHAVETTREFDALLDDPLAPDFFDRLGTMFDAMIAAGHGLQKSQLGYFYSKRGVYRASDAHILRWGRHGARINTISPGIVVTPMSKADLAGYDTTKEILGSIPIGRQGNPMDIALAVHFLASEDSGYITGADLLIDGGTFGSRRALGKSVYPIPRKSGLK